MVGFQMVCKNGQHRISLVLGGNAGETIEESASGGRVGLMLFGHTALANRINHARNDSGHDTADRHHAAHDDLVFDQHFMQMVHWRYFPGTED